MSVFQTLSAGNSGQPGAPGTVRAGQRARPAPGARTAAADAGRGRVADGEDDGSALAAPAWTTRSWPAAEPAGGGRGRRGRPGARGGDHAADEQRRAREHRPRPGPGQLVREPQHARIVARSPRPCPDKAAISHRAPPALPDAAAGILYSELSWLAVP